MSRILFFEKSVSFKDALLSSMECHFPDVVSRCVVSHEECLSELLDFTPDILLLGINIFSGTDLAFLDRICEVAPRVSVIVFTDYDITEYRKDAILRGASHVISKESWSGSEMLALIKTLLRTREKQSHIAS